MPLARPFVARTRESAAELDALITGGQQRERIFAKVDFTRAPQVNDFFVRVFVAMPEASARTPTDDPHYAGSFAFFGTHDGEHRHGHAPKLEFLVDVTGTLQRLKRQERLRPNEPITLTLQAVPVAGTFDRPDAMLELQRIELIVTPVVVAAR